VSADLLRAIAVLEERVRRGEAPDRYDLRALLVALGASTERPGGETWGRIHTAATALGAGFERAAVDELSLACAEHVHAVDPRYLDHPDYDFDYTLRARERLAFRLRAAAWLGLAAPESLRRAVEAADARLAPYLPDDVAEDAGGPDAPA